jgi:hypothetical protein
VDEEERAARILQRSADLIAKVDRTLAEPRPDYDERLWEVPEKPVMRRLAPGRRAPAPAPAPAPRPASPSAASMGWVTRGLNDAVEAVLQATATYVTSQRRLVEMRCAEAERRLAEVEARIARLEGRER